MTIKPLHLKLAALITPDIQRALTLTAHQSLTQHALNSPKTDPANAISYSTGWNTLLNQLTASPVLCNNQRFINLDLNVNTDFVHELRATAIRSLGNTPEQWDTIQDHTWRDLLDQLDEQLRSVRTRDENWTPHPPSHSHSQYLNIIEDLADSGYNCNLAHPKVRITMSQPCARCGSPDILGEVWELFQNDNLVSTRSFVICGDCHAVFEF